MSPLTCKRPREWEQTSQRRGLRNHMSRTFHPSVLERRVQRLEAEWRDISSRYLPLRPKDSLWRYHHIRPASEPAHGWKLHVSATVLNATHVLQKVAPVLVDYGVQFKAPSSLKDVMALNAGLNGAYSQVGKIITIYPRTSEEMVVLARRLHRLTRVGAGST